MDRLFLCLALLAGSCFLLGLLSRCLRRRGRRRVRLEIAPPYRSYLRRLGLTSLEHFLKLPAEVISGHLGRHVAHVTLGTGADEMAAFLKCEERVSWLVRLSNAVAGFGLVSRSLREARTLQELRREGIACPEWLAAGEDERGRAFLLVRAVTGGIDLMSWLRREQEPARRRRLAHHLGEVLARLHRCGFRHPDIYAKHVVVVPDDTVRLLDWQRAQRGIRLGWPTRARDLAALHATLAEDLASSRERLVFLRAYLREAARPTAEGEEVRSPGLPPRRLAAAVRAGAQRLLARRHLREKRQSRPTAEAQSWIHLDGEALSITPGFRRLCSGSVPAWLPLEQQPLPRGRSRSRRWPILPGKRRGLLLRQRSFRPLAVLMAWLRGQPLLAPEQRLAGLLFRLQRYAVAVPRVLAVGHRRSAYCSDSFLLLEPAVDAMRLDAWLLRQAPRAARAGATEEREDLAGQAGVMLQRLHEACCYLEPGSAGRALAVQLPRQGRATLVLEGVDALTSRRKRQESLARRDVAEVQRLLDRYGDGRAARHFLDRYHDHRRDEEEVIAAGAAEPASLPVQAPALPGPPIVRGRDTFWGRLVRGVRRLRQRDSWGLFAGPGWEDRILHIPITDRFQAKQGRTTGRWILTAPGEPGEPEKRLSVYLKRHYHLPWWQGLLATLWPGRAWSPALCEWEHLEWARQQGIPVPAVAAAGEYVGPWGRLQSFLAVEELAGMLPLSQAIPLAAVRLDAVAFRRWKRGLATEVARISRLLHDRRCFHKDLYLCHFYIAEEDTHTLPGSASWRGRVYVIDLHRLTRHGWTSWLWQTKDLAQLLYSSAIPGIDVRDQVFFWRAYRDTGPRRGSGRWLRRCVLLKWQRYCRHNARHRLEDHGERNRS